MLVVSASNETIVIETKTFHVWISLANMDDESCKVVCGGR